MKKIPVSLESHLQFLMQFFEPKPEVATKRMENIKESLGVYSHGEFFTWILKPASHWILAVVHTAHIFYFFSSADFKSVTQKKKKWQKPHWMGRICMKIHRGNTWVCLGLSAPNSLPHLQWIFHQKNLLCEHSPILCLPAASTPGCMCDSGLYVAFILMNKSSHLRRPL